MNCPAGVCAQSQGNCGSPPAGTTDSPVPASARPLTYRLGILPPLPLPANAIRFASGDQAGPHSTPESNVNREDPPRERSMSHTSVDAVRGSTMLTASRCPSGERRGRV